MKKPFRLLILFCIIAVHASAQKNKPYIFNIGDTAPPLRVKDWVKGSPIKNFEKGRVYIVEFWATWCKPCIASMPHLSALARENLGKATFLAVDVYEKKTTSLAQIKAFVDRMANKMDFPVATGESNFMERNWLEQSDFNGIPMTFVINRQGIVAWMGHPKDVSEVLRSVLNNTWNIKKALATQNSNKHLEELDRDASYKLVTYNDNYSDLKDLGRPDSALFVINKIIKQEPKMKYAPGIVLFTFSALLKTNPHEAYIFGKKAMVTTTYTDPAYQSITGSIENCSRKIKIPAEIYRLGAECYQAQIDNATYPELFDRTKFYRKAAKWYLLAGDKSKAAEMEQKAIYQRSL